MGGELIIVTTRDGTRWGLSDIHTKSYIRNGINSLTGSYGLLCVPANDGQTTTWLEQRDVVRYEVPRSIDEAREVAIKGSANA